MSSEWLYQNRQENGYFFLSAQADNRFIEDPDFNPGYAPQ